RRDPDPRELAPGRRADPRARRPARHRRDRRGDGRAHPTLRRRAARRLLPHRARGPRRPRPAAGRSADPCLAHPRLIPGPSPSAAGGRGAHPCRPRVDCGLPGREVCMQERTASEQAGAEAGPADQAARPPAAPPAQPDSPRTPSTAPRRSRSRLSFFAPRSSPVDPLLAPLLETMTAVSPKENQELVRQAYTVAERAHRGQARRSGDPYITHPVSVATILAELGSPADVVA